MRYAKHKTRRGVLLLVILALLAMFGMVAVTFVVVASQARLAAEAHQRLDETTDPPRKLLNAAVLQVLRGSTNPASAIGPHSLLEDVYGNDSVAGSGTLQYFDGDQSTEHHRIAVAVPAGLTTDAQRLRRVGCVLTVTANNFGCSTRIVGYDSATSQFLLLPFPGQTYDGTGTTVQLNGHDVAGEYIISGVPFSGAGFGWNGTAMTNLALQPGHSDNRLATVQANEDYDAADFQNMILAAQIPDGTTGQVVTIPSLHRPALVNNLGTGSDYILRPTKNQHPIFTGGNVNGATALGFDPVIGPWDVDNDGDGIADSIWVDLGMPARAAADGRLYKPLFAILCVDMDGKLNLNAHGGLAQVNDDPSGSTGNYYANPTPTTTGQQFAGTASLARGQGYGPAEINLGVLFSMPPAITLGANAGYVALLTGDGGSRPGRYGGNVVPGASGSESLGERRWFDYNYTAGYWPATSDPSFGSWSGYGTPPDMQGTMAVGLDLAGRPIWDQSYSGQVGADNPYESNPTHRVARGPVGGDDEPFSPAELERVLRCYDRDSLTLPPRLYELLQMGGIDVRYLRHDMTTDSVDVPVASIWVDPANPASGTRYATLVELLQAKYGIDATRAAEMFGPDLAAGRKLNLNRPLPTTDLVARQELARHLFCLAMLLRDPAYRFPFPTTDPNVSGKEEQLTIKRIAQWAVNVVDFIDADSTMTPFEYVEDPFASGVTWRTGLPSNTAGNATDMGRLVWGMERPDLLISETLAFHDRRVADTDIGGRRNKAKVPEPASGPEPADDDLDQPRMPQGSLFVELYCAAQPGAKGTNDLFELEGGRWQLAVNKTVPNASVWRLAITKNARSGPDSSASNIAARLNTAPATFAMETDQKVSLPPDLSDSAIPIERIVSFANFAVPQPSWVTADIYYVRGTPQHLEPGEYLLIGPRLTTFVGSTTGGQPSGQMLRLGPDPAFSGSDTEVTASFLSGGKAYPSLDSHIKRPKFMRAAAALGTLEIGISVSEPRPVGGSYYDPRPDGGDRWYDEPYDEALDQPLDSTPGKPLHDDGLLDTGTYEGYKYVLLQRLADPTRRYHQVNNPYRTVDWMPIDLTVFNGEDERPATWPPVDGDDKPIFPDTPENEWDVDDKNVVTADSRLKFATRQRAGQYNNLWETNPDGFSSPASTSPGTSSPQAFFKHPLQHSLGFLNSAFGTPLAGVGNPHLGDPASPFPWITWNNRPPASPLELMMVPATTAARHGWEYTMAAAGGPSAPYTPGADAGQYVYNAANVGYTHLMNFFHSGASGAASELHRIFDYVATPSRFAGAQHYVSGLSEPDHLQPTYREPGKVNLNTIYSERVFRGLMNGFGQGTNLWNQFVDSRRGYNVADAANYPTQFARPFRSASGAHLWPGSALAPAREIESTLLRSDPTSPEIPLFALSSTDEINDTGRNPYFRYQGLMRLANLTTTRSNVYAVWITVGYFEAAPNATITGGYQLGRELGVETGEIKRHRAFYMIDRSIPVGFVRGEDMNVESTIMLQRYVE